MSTTHPCKTLAQFAAGLTLAAIPAPVLRRAKDLLLDWLACALAGKGARPVETIARLAERMGPADGPCEILVHRTRSSPLMAAANAAASHFIEQSEFVKFYFPEGEIDFIASAPLTRPPAVVETVLGSKVRVQTSAEIIAKNSASGGPNSLRETFYL